MWVGLALSVLLLGVFLFRVDLERMREALAEANYLYLLPAVGMYLVSVLFRTIRWQALLRHMRPIPVRRLYPVVTVGYMANNLLPMRLGELVRSYYIGEREDISKTSALVTIVIERVMDALTLLFFIAVIAMFVPLTSLVKAFGEKAGIAWPLLVAALSAPFVLAFGMLMLFSLFPERTRAMVMTFVRTMPDRIEAPLTHLLDMFIIGLMPLRSPRTLANLFALSIPIWLFEAALFFLVGFAFGLENIYDNLGEMVVAVILITAVTNIGASIPATPGGIGLFELITMEALIVLAEVDKSVAAGYAAVVHLTLLLPMIVLGQVFLWIGNVSFRKLYRAGRAEQEDELASPSHSIEGDNLT